MIKRYRARPVEIEAVQWDGSVAQAKAISKWAGRRVKYLPSSTESVPVIDAHISIDTLEGVMRAQPKDYIVKGPAGEFYPVKPDIFEWKYEEVE